MRSVEAPFVGHNLGQKTDEIMEHLADFMGSIV